MRKVSIVLISALLFALLLWSVSDDGIDLVGADAGQRFGANQPIWSFDSPPPVPPFTCSDRLAALHPNAFVAVSASGGTILTPNTVRFNVTSASFWLNKTGLPNAIISVAIYNSVVNGAFPGEIYARVPTGSALATSASLNTTTLNTNPATWTTFNFAGTNSITLSKNVFYSVALQVNSVVLMDGSNFVAMWFSCFGAGNNFVDQYGNSFNSNELLFHNSAWSNLNEQKFFEVDGFPVDPIGIGRASNNSVLALVTLIPVVGIWAYIVERDKLPPEQRFRFLFMYALLVIVLGVFAAFFIAFSP